MAPALISPLSISGGHRREHQDRSPGYLNSRSVDRSCHQVPETAPAVMLTTDNLQPYARYTSCGSRGQCAAAVERFTSPYAGHETDDTARALVLSGS